jgi:hypothetical protein
MTEPNSYHRELVRVRQAVAKGDVATVRELFESLWAKFQDDIEQERREAHAAVAKELLEADGPQALKLARGFAVKWFDIPASRFLFPDIEDPEKYFGLLDHILTREDVGDELAPAIGGKEAMRILKDCR